MHARIANVRRDYLHQASTAISKNHALVGIEELQVRNMSKPAAGTRTAPGNNVKAKSGLNKAILDQAGSNFAASWTTSCNGAGLSDRGAATEYEPPVSAPRPCVGAQPPDSSAVRVRRRRL